MPRYYRRRYTRVVKPKKKWASNFVDLVFDSEKAGPGGTSLTLGKTVGLTQTLCVNSVQGGNPTPVILKAGNFKVQLDCVVNSGQPSDMGFDKTSVYIMYLPEGVGLTGDPTPAQAFSYYGPLVNKHPEWILGWKLIGGDLSTDVNTERVTFSSRLKRNLNSGDRIILFFMSESNANFNMVKIHSITQFWTCAN